MASDFEYDDDFEDDSREPRRKRRRHSAGPRIGSFVTIAVALLVLFGAASRMGKAPETAALFGIDQQAEMRINNEIGRIRAALTLGAVPVSAQQPQKHVMPIDHNSMPPARQEVDLDTVRRPTISMALPNTREDQGNDDSDGSGSGYSAFGYDEGQPGAFQPRPTEQPQAQEQPRRPESYTVAQGDTWVKIATRTLGDGKRWQEIQKANPKSANGLQVGMQLKIPR